MNNQTLAFVVSGMINELRQTIDIAASKMPEGAERQQKELVYYTNQKGEEMEPTGNPLLDLSALSFAKREVHYIDDSDGTYVTLSPLYDLLDEWTNRISMIELEQEVSA